MTLTEALIVIDKDGSIPNIGQFSPDAKRMLDRMVKKGFLGKTRGYWSVPGLGPLKTIYTKEV